MGGAASAATHSRGRAVSDGNFHAYFQNFQRSRRVLDDRRERVNSPFLEEGGTPDQFRSALSRALSLGWLWLHESGTYVKFTPAGAELFA
jgi:hypothetical protein